MPQSHVQLRHSPALVERTLPTFSGGSVSHQLQLDEYPSIGSLATAATLLVGVLVEGFVISDYVVLTSSGRGRAGLVGALVRRARFAFNMEVESLSELDRGEIAGITEL